MPTPKMFDLSRTAAAVTGGNGGIGLGIALGLAEAGAAVAILARNDNKNRDAVAAIEKRGGRAVAITLDVTKRDQLEPKMAEVERSFGPVDILVNNAGIAMSKDFLDYETRAWDAVLETNLNSVFLLSQIAARSMAQRKRGKIINIASEYSRFGSSWVPAYSASKGGVVQLTKSMAIALAPHNIQVNAILPGWIWSEMTAGVKDTPLYKEIIQRTPAGRFGEPEECAGAAVFLASRASDFVTGSTVYVDGGYAIR